MTGTLQSGALSRSTRDFMAEYRANLLKAQIAYDEDQTVQTRADYIRAMKAIADFALSGKAPNLHRDSAA
jgi:hypothetical protein